MSTYVDQKGVEIYDGYDLNSGEPIPVLIQEAIDKGKEKRGVVTIDYPVVNGIWSLNGIGRTPFDEEAGKKAFVRGGYYEHPAKEWRSQLEFMTPYEYIEACADLFTDRRRDGKIITPEILIEHRLGDYDVVEVFNKHVGNIFYPNIDYKFGGQEGLHRAIFAMMVNQEKIPVIVIYSDKRPRKYRS